MEDEFLDVIFWGKQCAGLVFGVTWGIIPLTGFVGILLFVLLVSSLCYTYFSSYVSIDEDEFGGAWEIMKEGFLPCFATFLVSWILTYTSFHSNL